MTSSPFTSPQQKYGKQVIPEVAAELLDLEEAPNDGAADSGSHVQPDRSFLREALAQMLSRASEA